MHSRLFRPTMATLGLSTIEGAYLDDVPALTPALNNALTADPGTG